MSQKAPSPIVLPTRERLERVIAHQGLASRREAKELISTGKVRVNNVVVTEPGFGIITGKDTITIDSAGVLKQSVLVYKPRGIETNKTTPGAKDLHDTFKEYKHLAPIGRLDKESEGLIIMSNDGVLTKAFTAVGSHIAKVYSVTVREFVPDAVLQKMERGIVLDRLKTKPAQTKRLSRSSFLITLHEGRKHQIRRMCDACGLTIATLTRVAIGHLEMGRMKPGQGKVLSQHDVELLKK